MLRLKTFVGLLACASLVACKEYKPGPSCAETALVTERNGHRVYQTLSDVYLKADEVDMRACGSKPYSEDPWQKKFVARIHQNYYWGKGRLIRTDAELRDAGLKPAQAPLIELHIEFEPDFKHKPPPTWWYAPAIPHQRYPIDLLPNFGLDQPDPNAGVGPILSKPTVYWAVRGTKSWRDGLPFTTFCGIHPPPGNAENDVAYQRDPKWLVQGQTSIEKVVGNTCRGGVSATNGKLGAMIDVPGAALPDIDKIYQAVSLKLTELTVE